MKNKNEEQKKEFTGVWIPYYIIENTALKPVDKILYAEIACYKTCWKKSSELMKICGIRKKAFQASCRRLKELGYIEEKRVFGRIHRNIFSSGSQRHQTQKGADEQTQKGADEQTQKGAVHLDNKLDNKEITHICSLDTHKGNENLSTIKNSNSDPHIKSNDVKRKEKVPKKEKKEISNSKPKSNDVKRKEKVPKKEKKDNLGEMADLPKDSICDEYGRLRIRPTTEKDTRQGFGKPDTPEAIASRERTVSKELIEVANEFRRELFRKQQAVNTDFEEGFYKFYPVKRSKAVARKIFNKLKKEDKIYICKAVHKFIASKDITDHLKRGEKRFIVHPSTWLNQRRWEDEEVEDDTKTLTTDQIKQKLHDKALEYYNDPEIENSAIRGKISSDLTRLIGGGVGMQPETFFKEIVPDMPSSMGSLI